MKTQKVKAKPEAIGTLTIGGIEYVVVPRADYLKHTGTLPRGSVEAHTHIRASLADGLRAAREHAGLTQGQLAEKLGVNLRTAEGHRAALMRKMSFDSLADLVRYAVRNSIIDL